jgi:CHRD domain
MMDSTQLPLANLAENKVVLNERRPALPWVVWRHTFQFLHARKCIEGKGRRGRLRLLPGTFVMAVVLFVFSGCAAAQNAVSPAPTISDGGGMFVATLAPESPNTHGSGTARLLLNPDQQMICSVIHVKDIEVPATAAHIHQGAAGTKGPIVVHLQPPNAQGVSTSCTRAPRKLIVAIMDHPAGYYVNVHNMSYPEGAVRGQLAVCTSHMGC